MACPNGVDIVLLHQSQVLQSLFPADSVSGDRVAVLYGSISGIIVILLWLYIISNILMLGVELNAVLYEMDEKP